MKKVIDIKKILKDKNPKLETWYSKKRERRILKKIKS